MSDRRVRIAHRNGTFRNSPEWIAALKHSQPVTLRIPELAHPPQLYLHGEQDLYVSDVLPQTGRVMVKDEDLCVHCSLCAERCPTGAWDMQKSKLLVPYAKDELEEAKPVAASGS